ncbi:helix-hairpin-helix domain-containing protein [Ureaplasma miroungigenitalium]|uniref:Holliday junction branch migration complex subunit RuvA n=1 Tax=Ureaplasma miroungigenitalium TaxID=1042321 RepID=A0ABT3BLU4_9BACT|nr:Holliday junction branch migration protein RuvA [Ureaplasma miroungigenitalium]MCV3728230.1 helix-hairpin-helix domain-containing protein [Ureaplasma miroungigenitalium]MCV3734034.1 helix-hairpin-helix domain-containing protein [Ureaplasma miroungigenitalium]
MNYIILKITQSYSSFLLGENGFVGYLIKTPKDYNLEINKYARIYIYQHLIQVNNKNIWRQELYGFKNLYERNLFVDLLNVNGIGVKSALMILRQDCEMVMNALATRDLDTLISIKGFNQKVASLAINLLAEKYLARLDSQTSANKKTSVAKELISGLKSLGYDKQAIDYALSKLDIQKANTEELMTQAIREISLLNEH